MSRELEDRLERVADALPAPSSDSRDRARSAALAGVPEKPRSRRRAFLLVPAIALALGVGVVAFLAVQGRDGPLATERALAALGHQPVIHAIVEQPDARESVILDLATGRERPGDSPRWEYWYDDERDYMRVRLSVGDKPLPGGEYLQTPEGFFTDRGVQRGQMRPPQLDPALEGFASGYRESLDSGEATVVGEAVMDGHEAVILRFSLPPGPSGEQRSEDVAVDADDYRPLRFRFSGPMAPGTSSWSEAPRVIEIETIPRDPRDFERPQPGEPRPGGQTGVDERKLQPAEAATALGRTVFWPGPAIDAVELAQIELMRLTTNWTDGRVTEGHSLVFQYGADRRTAHLEGRPSLFMTLGTSAQENPRYDVGGSTTQPGELRLTGVGRTDSGDREMWFGAMQRDGVYISFESRERELIVAAAKAMRPLS
jgi:hypothetical protein